MCLVFTPCSKAVYMFSHSIVYVALHYVIFSRFVSLKFYNLMYTSHMLPSVLLYLNITRMQYGTYFGMFSTDNGECKNMTAEILLFVLMIFNRCRYLSFQPLL